MYEILTDFSCLDIADDAEKDIREEQLVNDQDITLYEHGYENDCFTEYVIQYGTGVVRLDTIDDAIQSLALKDGADLVMWDDGAIGFVSYCNGFSTERNCFRILRKPTDDDKNAWINGEELKA